MYNNENKSWAKRVDLFEYLISKQFVIPVYQRDFVWNKDQIIEFLNELYILRKTTLDENNDNLEMFVGSIYLKKNEKGNFEIIDGQQRTILFYFLKLFFLEDSKYSIQTLINKYDFAIRTNPTSKRSNIDQPILNWAKELKLFLENFTLISITKKFEDGLNSNRKNSKIKNRLADLSFSLEDEILKEIIIPAEKKKESEASINIAILEFIKFIFTKISLIEIKIKPLDDINEIFKSINSKGRSLNQWDLIRNEIYKNSISINEKKYKKEIESQLNRVDEFLEKFNEKWFINSEEFIWSYVIFKKEEYISKKDLATQFALLSKEKNITLLTLLLDIEKYYNILDNYDNSLNQFKWFFYICKEIRAVQIKIVVLAVFMNQEFKNYFSWVERLLVNFLVLVNIGGKRANYFEKFFKSKNPDVLKQLLGNDEKLINKLINEEDFYDENLKYINHFTNKEKAIEGIANELTEANKMLKVYIYLKTFGNQKDLIFSTLNYEYEHVLPKKFDEWQKNDVNWKEIKKEKIETYVEKIGNFILLKSELNKKVSNKLLNFKMNEYYCETFVDKKTGKVIEPEHTIFCKGLDLFEKDLKFLIPIFNDFQDAHKNNKFLEFSPELINKRTKEISTVIAELFLNKF